MIVERDREQRAASIRSGDGDARGDGQLRASRDRRARELGRASVSDLRPGERTAPARHVEEVERLARRERRTRGIELWPRRDVQRFERARIDERVDAGGVERVGERRNLRAPRAIDVGGEERAQLPVDGERDEHGAAGIERRERALVARRCRPR